MPYLIPDTVQSLHAVHLKVCSIVADSRNIDRFWQPITQKEKKFHHPVIFFHHITVILPDIIKIIAFSRHL